MCADHRGNIVDGPVADMLATVTETSLNMLIKLCAVILFSPAFIVPGLVVFAVGGWVGQVYMAGQMTVKREMSNAKAPVLTHFSASIAGLGNSAPFLHVSW